MNYLKFLQTPSTVEMTKFVLDKLDSFLQGNNWMIYIIEAKPLCLGAWLIDCHSL